MIGVQAAAVIDETVQTNAPEYPKLLPMPSPVNEERRPSSKVRSVFVSERASTEGAQSESRALVLVLGACGDEAQSLASELRGLYRVVMSSDLDAAYRTLKGTSPDLVIAGHQGIHGPDLPASLARKFGNAVPLLYLISSDELRLDWDLFAVEGAEFMVTPVIPQVMFSRVRTLLRMKRQSDLLREVAGLDQSTLIFNRSRFESQLELEWRAGQRERSPLGVVLVSVDHFEAYLRHMGHQAGEEALGALADVLRAALRRPRDFLARYGREEFAVLLPGSDEEAALQTASYLCREVAQAKLPYCGSVGSAHLSISAGAASCGPDGLSSPRRLMKMVDDHLYVAMMSGRNQARSSSQSTKPPVNGQLAIY